MMFAPDIFAPNSTHILYAPDIFTSNTTNITEAMISNSTSRPSGMTLNVININASDDVSDLS